MNHKKTSAFKSAIRLFMMAGLIGCYAIQANAQAPTASTSHKVLVVGFVGGLRNPEDRRQGVVQISDRLRGLECSDLEVRTFSHWHWKDAYQWIHEVMAYHQDGGFSKEEHQNAAKIVIYGHSLGGWAVVKLSRKLEKAHIPVELSVQIDTVGLGDAMLPKNVKSAANFYQRTEWPIRGEKSIKAGDEKTKVFGNFLIRGVGHDALARTPEISDFMVEHVHLLCAAEADSKSVQQTPEP